MKLKILISIIYFLNFPPAFAADLRDEAILNSKMVKAIVSGLWQEQNLKCQIAIEEDGSQSIAYFIENGLSKFNAVFACSGGDGRSAIITGVIGDGGKTHTETFKMVFAN